MKFPNAYKGVKKLFIAEIIALIGAIASLVVAIFAKLPGYADEKSPIFIVAGILAFVILIALIVAYVIQVVGLYQGGKDEHYLKVGFFVVIFSLILGIVGSILTTWVKGAAQIGSIIDTICKVADAFVIIFVIFGVMSLAAELGNESMVKLGKSLCIMVIIMYVLSIVIRLIAAFVKTEDNALAVALGVLGIIGIVLELVIYVINFVYLGKAVKMLKE